MEISVAMDHCSGTADLAAGLLVAVGRLYLLLVRQVKVQVGPGQCIDAISQNAGFRVFEHVPHGKVIVCQLHLQM